MALRPEQIATLRDACERIARPIVEWLLRDAAERIAGAGQVSSTAAYELYRAASMAQSQNDLEEFLKKQLKIANSEIQAVFRQAAKWSGENDLNRFGIDHKSFSGEYEQMAEAAIALAEADFQNLTQTLGMIAPDGKALPLREFYQRSMDFAFQQTFTGATGYDSAIRQATAKLASQGVRSIDYQNGTHTSIEAATRRNIMGGMGLMDERITQSNYDRLGCDGWEISAHANSAPDHEPYQGKQYSDSDYRRLNSSLQRRIGTLNCGHTAMPIILGVNSPQYTNEQLEYFRQSNADGIVYQGRHYTGYEAQQKQRQIERAMRIQKNRILVADATGDLERMQVAQSKLHRLDQEYKNFSHTAGLRTQFQRMEVAGFRNVPSENLAVVHTVAQLDPEKYRCVSESITTNEVVITDERISHIRERHPNDYERYMKYMADIIADPDYIIEANKADTAVLLKEFIEGADRFKLILRLKTPKDPDNYKNSVISFWRIGDRTWKKSIKNKKILYRRE